MSESVYEQRVAVKRSGGRIYGGIILFLAVLALIVYISFIFVGIAAVIIGWVVGMLFYFFIFPYFTVEYEYTMINQSLDIDAVYGKAKRKRLYSINLREVELIAPAGSTEIQRYRDVRVKNLTSGREEHPVYSIIVMQNSEKMKLMIEPDEVLLEKIRRGAGMKFAASTMKY